MCFEYLVLFLFYVVCIYVVYYRPILFYGFVDLLKYVGQNL